ncbi:hypothetical protein WAI453_010681 [Rhynchosporium graminicola]
MAHRLGDVVWKQLRGVFIELVPNLPIISRLKPPSVEYSSRFLNMTRPPIESNQRQHHSQQDQLSPRLSSSYNDKLLTLGAEVESEQHVCVCCPADCSVWLISTERRGSLVIGTQISKRRHMVSEAGAISKVDGPSIEQMR